MVFVISITNRNPGESITNKNVNVITMGMDSNLNKQDLQNLTESSF